MALNLSLEAKTLPSPWKALPHVQHSLISSNDKIPFARFFFCWQQDKGGLFLLTSYLTFLRDKRIGASNSQHAVCPKE